MGLLDRYIARQYLINTFALIVILFGFVITVDVSINLERFIKSAQAAAEIGTDGEPTDPNAFRTAMLTVLVIVDLWWPKLLHLFNYISGMVLVGAMGFTCTQLVRNRELIALLAAGQSLQRVVRPLMVVAFVITGLQLANQELLIPRIAPLIARDHGDAYRRGLGVQPVPLTSDGLSLMVQARAFDADAGTLEGLFMLELEEDGSPKRAIKAERATWRDGGWDLEGAIAESRQPAVGGERSVPESVDRVETGLDPTRLRMQAFSVVRQALSFAQIGQLLSRPDLLDERSKEDLTRLRWGRFSVMASNLLAVVIAMPFFLTRLPSDFVQRTLKAAPLASVAILGGVFGASADLPGVPALVGVFLPVVLLTPFAIASAASIKT